MEKMRNLITRNVRVFVLVLNLVFVPMASLQATSLDELTQEPVIEAGAEVSEPADSGGTGEVTTPNGNTVMDGLAKDSDMSKEDADVVEFRAAVQGITSKVIQIIAVIATFGLVLILGADLLYLLLPPFRGILANGNVGVAKTDPNAQQQGGMGMGGMSGGYGGGYGGMSSGYGGYGGMSGGMGMGGQQGQPQPNKFCLVSDEALNAVATAKQEPTGRLGLAMSLWFKHAVVYLVATPVIITLLLTGALQKIGYGLGYIIAEGITKFAGNM